MNKIILSILVICGWAFTDVQAQNPGTLRIVDSLTAQEKASRNPIILRSELDSLNTAYYKRIEVPATVPAQQSPSSQTDLSFYVMMTLMVFMLFLFYFLYRQQQAINRLITGLYSERPKNHQAAKNKMNRAVGSEGERDEILEQIQRLTEENEGLDKLVKQYNGIEHEFESLRQGLSRNYKINNYPGNDSAKGPASMQQVLDTEHAVAMHAYEKFLKPILAITDQHKNNPARINIADKQKLVELLVALSLLYIEYLYLRVSDLSVGGKIVERLRAFSKGGEIDPAELKPLNTESGSRALVMRMALDHARLFNFRYPVFDETNLNR